MGVDHPGLGFSLEDLLRVVRREAVATLQNSSIGRAGLRFYAGGKALFQGGGGVEIQDSGYIIIDGDLTGAGDFNWAGLFNQEGQSTFTGPTVFTGTINATGNTAWSGLMSIIGDLQVILGGRIMVGPITIDRSGPAGGRIRSTGQLILGDGTGSVYVNGSTTVAGPLGVTGMTNLTGGLDVSGGPKSFKMDHPTKPGWWLRHGSTESPVSGIEYWGESSIGPDGAVRIELPDYFDALAKPEGRVVLVTARGFIADWSDIDENAFTVTGTAGGRFSWLVKAERHSADFLVEEEQSSDG